MSILLSLLAWSGCEPSSPERVEDYLIRLGELKVTRHEFLQAFELVKTAHPSGVDSDSPELQHARRQLLNELTTELILLKHSQEQGVTVSQAELDDAVAAVKADYPAGVFEQTLIESAIPLAAWKQRLQQRLLMEKLVNVELRPQITITAEDLAAYYAQNYGGKAAEVDSGQMFERLKETLVADLRRAKMEEAFAAWIDGLKKRYPVELNASQWAFIVASGPKAASSQSEATKPGK